MAKKKLKFNFQIFQAVGLLLALIFFGFKLVLVLILMGMTIELNNKKEEAIKKELLRRDINNQNKVANENR